MFQRGGSTTNQKLFHVAKWCPVKVHFRGELYTADQQLGRRLHRLQEEEKQRFCVKIRVIPLCPGTAKVVLANSSPKLWRGRAEVGQGQVQDD